MRISKDNATFLNNPHTVVFSLAEGIAFTQQMTGGSPHMVASLVTFDAPIHMKYRKLTQDWFMPKNLRNIEAEIRAIAEVTVDRMLAAGPEVDFCKTVSAPYPLHVVMQILGVPEEDEPRMLMLTQQLFGGQDDDLNQSGDQGSPARSHYSACRRSGRRFRGLFCPHHRRPPGQSARRCRQHHCQCGGRWRTAQ